jgi:asparagine synthase (glutamine-hydrolysing)
MFYESFSLERRNGWAFGMKTWVAVLNKQGENATPAVIDVLEALHKDEKVCFSVATQRMFLVGHEITQLKSHEACSSVVVGATESMDPPMGEPQVMYFGDLTAVFNGVMYDVAEKKPRLEMFFQSLKGDRVEFAKGFVETVDGDYSLVLAEEGKLVSARDPVGVAPMYYGESNTIAALASNRKALWRLGIAEPKSFLPGHVASATREGFEFKPVKTLPFHEPEQISIEEAAETLQRMLEVSVMRRVQGMRKVTVAFSGGLDSSLVAFLAKKLGVEVELVHVSLENHPETAEAVRAAMELDLPLQVHLYKDADVERDLPTVIGLIEEPDPVKAGVGLSFYWAAQKAGEERLKVLLAGQGADELFGGYQRYVTEYLAQGDEQVRRTMYHDVAYVYESNLERDEKICLSQDVELRLPFASFELAKFATSLPTELKFEKRADSLRKLVLRQVALNLGLSKAIVEKPKKAVQYCTGISNALKRIAKKQGLTLAEYTNKLFMEARRAAEPPQL